MNTLSSIWSIYDSLLEILIRNTHSSISKYTVSAGHAPGCVFPSAALLSDLEKQKCMTRYTPKGLRQNSWWPSMVIWSQLHACMLLSEATDWATNEAGFSYAHVQNVRHTLHSVDRKSHSHATFNNRAVALTSKIVRRLPLRPSSHFIFEDSFF